MREAIESVMESKGIEVIYNTKVVGYQTIAAEDHDAELVEDSDSSSKDDGMRRITKLVTEDGRSLPFDQVFLCTNVGVSYAHCVVIVRTKSNQNTPLPHELACA